jgi:hypothetical protein
MDYKENPMHKALLRSLAAVAGAITLTVGMATSAFAGPPFTVTVAGSTAGSYAVAGDSTSAVSIHAGVDYTCSSVHFDGTVPAGATSATIADLTGSTWSSCITFLGLDLSVQQIGTWEVDATSGPDDSGVTAVQVTGIDAIVTDTSTDGGICSYEVKGSAPGNFTNGTQIVQVNATSLTVSNVSGCFGLVSGPMSFSGTFHVTNPATDNEWPVTIS